MTKYTKILTLMTSTSLLSVSLMGGTAFAQLEPTANDLDEIIVTGARGRVENEVEVPIAVTVFTEQEIQDAQIERVDDFIALTPGITIANSQDSGSNFITIRGVSNTRNGEPPVAVLVDGVLQFNGRAFDQPLFDVESIEVLKGPQGQLYGRNATQGAIIINTKGPSDEFEGYIQASAAEGDDFAIEGSISGPISDDISYRLSAKYRDRGGQLDNLTLNTPVDFTEEIALRGHLHWDVTDKLEADLRGSYSEVDGGALNFRFQLFPIDPATGLAGDFEFINDANQVERDFFANNLGSDDRDVGQLSLRLKYDLGFAELTSTSAYDTLTQQTTGDGPPYSAGLTDGTQTQYVNTDAFSQELRLTSTLDGPLRWVVGGYYLNTDRFINTVNGTDTGQGIVPRQRINFVDDTNPVTQFFADDNDNEAWALFANIDYAVTDRLEIGLGARYDEDDRTRTVSEDSLNLINGVNATNPGAVDTANFSAFQPKVTLRYLLSDSVSVYGSWGEGFRSGQFNQSGTASAAAGGAFDGAPDILDQEDTETFEIGFKSSFGDTIDFNAALYDTSVTNAPFFVFVPEVIAQILVPIDEVSIQGGEAELTARLNDDLYVYAGAAFSDSEIDENVLQPGTVGNDAPYVPSSTFNVGGQYRFPVSDFFGMFARVDFESRGPQFWDPDNSTERDRLDLLHLKLGIEDNDGRWSVIGSVDNATDLEYNSEFVVPGFAHAAPPRQFKVDFRYNF